MTWRITRLAYGGEPPWSTEHMTEVEIAIARNEARGDRVPPAWYDLRRRGVERFPPGGAGDRSPQAGEGRRDAT